MRTIVRLRIVLLGVLAVACMFVALHFVLNKAEADQRKVVSPSYQERQALAAHRSQ